MSTPVAAESSIVLSNVRLYAYHGVLEQERTVGGWYAVSLRVGYDITEAAATDAVEHTLNYATLLDLVRREMDVPSNLLEHVASRIGHAVLQRFPGASDVWLRVLKMNPPMGADCDGAGVELHLINDKTRG